MKFCAPQSVKSASAAYTSNKEEVDVAFDKLSMAMRTEPSRLWNFIELYDLYISSGRRNISCRTLVSKLLEYFGSDLLMLSGVGVASLLVFRSKASSMMRLVSSSDEDDIEIELEKVAHQIVQDVKDIQVDNKNYNARVVMDIVALNCVSSTCYPSYQSFLQS